MSSRNKYLRLASCVFLKELEFPAVYDTCADELYRVDPEGFMELSRCDGTLKSTEAAFPEDFISFCIEEGILEVVEAKTRVNIAIGRNEIPSLRYLMVEVTDRCNLACRHCYLGDTHGVHISVKDFERVLNEFEEMGGLRLIVTGGEPLMHPEFRNVNSMCSGRSFRSILVTNGTLIDEDTAGLLEFDEVQVSIDGMEEGHDFIRGPGSFKAALRGIENTRRTGTDISVATMLHKRNMKELDSLESLVKNIGALSWTLDVPCESGRLSEDDIGIIPDVEEAAPEMERAFGSEQHEPSGEYACGAHLAFVKAGGKLIKCGFYEDWSGGTVGIGLRNAWLDLPRMKVSELNCDCEFLKVCGGGCRFRAETMYGRCGPDPLKCAQFGVKPSG